MVNFAKTSKNEKGQLVADKFGDVYFSPTGGYEESKYVFLHGNHLPDRWRESHEFTIIETGFGTGLNFLTTWELWDKQATSQQQLHFISVEKFPLNIETFNNSLHAYPNLKRFSIELNKHYPDLIKNEVNTIQISTNVKLTLLIGDVLNVLRKAPNKADAWFLDGFSPKKNPEMWNTYLYNQIAKLSNNNATFATFTAATHVRNGLTEAGFKVERIKGFSYKKHMCRGILYI
ncbi:MAG: tRNA 5-methylaminomethyl-2-thiouridine biosynthesis bifunctional protein [Alphaproteobacteria bacterium]|jgi:tRNA 5-methylaminomethyl-2-thiouridine biosynthesis bifunctional protein